MRSFLFFFFPSRLVCCCAKNFFVRVAAPKNLIPPTADTEQGNRIKRAKKYQNIKDFLLKQEMASKDEKLSQVDQEAKDAYVADYNSRVYDLISRIQNEYLGQQVIQTNGLQKLNMMMAWAEEFLVTSERVDGKEVKIGRPKEMEALYTAWPFYVQYRDRLEQCDESLWRIPTMLGLDKVRIDPMRIWELCSPEARTLLWAQMKALDIVASNINDIQAVPLDAATTMDEKKMQSKK